MDVIELPPADDETRAPNELSDEDLEVVVGGLSRAWIYLPGEDRATEG